MSRLPSWPPSRLEDALAALVRHCRPLQHRREVSDEGAGGGQDRRRRAALPGHGGLEARLSAEIPAAAAMLGLEAMEVEVPAGQIGEVLAGAPPALLVLPEESGPRLLVIARAARGPCRRQRLRIVVARGRLRAVALAEVQDQVQDLLVAPQAARHSAGIEELLARAEVPRHRRPRARALLLARLLAAGPANHCWLVRLPESAGSRRLASEAGLLPFALKLAGSLMARQAVLLLAWGLLAQLARSPAPGGAGLLAWALLWLGAPVLQALSAPTAVRLAVSAGCLLRRRLLGGILRAGEAELAHEGVGGQLGRLLETEACERNLLAGAGALPAALAELGLAAALAAPAAPAVSAAMAGRAGLPGGTGPGGRDTLSDLAGGCLLPALLGTGLFLIAACAWRYFSRRRAWASCRRQLTEDFVERLLGHRTRLVQPAPAPRRDIAGDSRLARYCELSRRMDVAGSWLLGGGALARAWLAAGLLALLLAMAAAGGGMVGEAGRGAEGAAGGLFTAALAGLLLGWSALDRLGGALAGLAEAGASWSAIRPFLRSPPAAPGRAGDPDAARAAAAPPLQTTTADVVAQHLDRAVHRDPPCEPAEVEHAAAPSAPAEPEVPTDLGAAVPPLLEAHRLVWHPAGRNRPGGPLLDGCSLAVRHGERILLEGASGSGKTALARLLAGACAPTAGALLLEGLDRHVLGAEAWRRRVAVVPQLGENHLFADSLAFNLLLGRGWPPSSADLEEAAEVCRELGLGDLLARMPEGLDQVVGESGWPLSQGERSRVYAARGLLQGARLIILDETAAALDPATLRRTLACLCRRAPALILIAHS